MPKGRRWREIVMKRVSATKREVVKGDVDAKVQGANRCKRGRGI